jgi:PAS domain S-box-containing protein
MPDIKIALTTDVPKSGPPHSNLTTQEPLLPIESALYLAIIENAGDAIIAKGLDGTVITWNASARRIFGYTAAEMIGGPITRLFPADRLSEEPELISQVVMGRSVDNFVTRRIRKDGASIDVSVTLSPVRDVHGQIVAVSKIARDVAAARQRYIPDEVLPVDTRKLVVRKPVAQSKRTCGQSTDKRTHANRALGEKINELVRNEQRFQTLVRITSQVIWTTNPQGRIEGAQPGLSAFTGQSFDDYQGFGWSAALHPEDAQPTIDEWSRCIADRRPFLFEHRVRRHDGAYRTCTINAAPILNADGTIREWVGVHNDITERRQQEDQIRADEAKFRFLAESLPQLVWTATPNGVIDYYNQRWFNYTGMTLDQTQGWGAVLHPDDLENCARNWNDSLESGKPIESELRLLRAGDGTYRWHLGRGVALRDAHGVIVKWIGTSTEIDDYKKAEAKNLALHAELEDRVEQRTAELARVGKIAGVGGWSVTVASGDVYWSDEACRIHDVRPGHQPTLDEAIGMYIPDSRDVIEAACQNCMTNAKPFDLELQLTTAQGRGIWVRAVGEAQMEQGTVVRICGAFQDITTRKLAERELFDHDALLRVTLDSIGDAVITTDAQGQVQSLNPRAAQLTGWAVSESRGLPVEQVFNIVDAQTQQRTSELIGQVLSDDRPAGTRTHTVLTARDGTEIDIEDSVAPIRDKTGQVVGSVLVFRDVSERQRAADAVRSANERFAFAADAAGIGVWEWELSSNALRWDDQMYRLYGQSPVEGVEPFTLWTHSLHADDRARVEREIHDALRDNAGFNIEFRIVQPSGEIRHLSAAAQIQTDAAGVAMRMIGVNYDITARKQAEMDLKQTSSLLRMVLDSSSDLAILATAPDLTIRVFNKGAERLLGCASAEVIGCANPAVFHDAVEIEARGLELSTLLGRPVHGAGVFTEPTTLDVPREWTFIRKDQRRVPVSLTVSAMFDDSGILSGYMGFARDITRDREHERSIREAKSQAERANAAKSEFLAHMSHEIRTPLNAVIGLGYLLEQTTLSDEQRASLREINFAGHSLLAVINDILDLSKIEAGEMRLEDAELDLKHLVQSIGKMLTPSAHAKGIALSVHCAADLPSQLRGDATRLRQIATNLLNNAIKFTEKGQVELILSGSKPTAAGISVSMTVRDTGIGMDAKGLARLFKPFSQADSSTTRRFGGTGLGLSITRHLVDMMGGEIRVTSTLGVGSEFWAEIPLQVADAGIRTTVQATPTNSGDTLPLAGARILVVDDVVVNLKVAQHILKRHGAVVTTSGTGADALERLRLTPNGYDIVLMDVQMPDMDGNETTRRIRTELQLKTLPIIALTAGALASERELSLLAGMNDFLTKPFDPVALIAILHRHLKQKPIASFPTSIIEHALGAT